MKKRERGDWRWLAVWAAVAAWGLMVVISAWGAFPGKHWRGRGETAAGVPLRVYLRGVFPGKQGRFVRVAVGRERALSYGYRRR